MIETIARSLQGRKQSDGSFMVLCPAHADKNPSLHVTQAGEKILVNCMAGCSQESVISALKSRGLWHGKVNGTDNSLPAGIPSKWGKDADTKAYVAHWQYHDLNGNVIGYAVRYQQGEDKVVIPFFKQFGEAWKAGAAPEPRHLYNLHFLNKSPESPVLVIEGEKAADAARILAGQSYICVTWPGGCKAADKADWKILKGRSVVIWPDADEPGRKAALTVQEQCVKVGVKSFKIVEPPKDVKPGWDLADAKVEGWTAEKVLEYINRSKTDGNQKNNPSRKEITYFSGADIIAKPMKIEWLIVGMFSMNESILIHAAGGIGKSMFILFLLVTLAAFRDNLEDSLDRFFDDFIIPKRRCSLVIGSENGRVSMYQRLKLMCNGSNHFEDGLKNVFFMSQYDDTTISGEVFLDESFCTFLVAFIQTLEQEQNVKIDILVIDPLISFSGASDENSSAEMRPALDAIDGVCRQVKCTPIVIHHDKKDGDNYRGSTAINDWARNRISLKRELVAENRITDQAPDGTVTGQRVVKIPVIRVTHEKCNNFQMFAPFLIKMTKHLHFKRINEQMTPEETEKVNTVAQALKDMGDYAESSNALAKVYEDLTGVSKNTAKKCISLAVDNGVITRKSTIIKGKSAYEFYSLDS